MDSFSPTSESVYSTTNQDHLNDLLEAWEEIRASPIVGLGIGRFYETPLLTPWKETSFEVHNALLQVWLKFGLIGLIAFLGFHLAWGRASLEWLIPRPWFERRTPR